MSVNRSKNGLKSPIYSDNDKTHYWKFIHNLLYLYSAPNYLDPFPDTLTTAMNFARRHFLSPLSSVYIREDHIRQASQLEAKPTLTAYDKLIKQITMDNPARLFDKSFRPVARSAYTAIMNSQPPPAIQSLSLFLDKDPTKKDHTPGPNLFLKSHRSRLKAWLQSLSTIRYLDTDPLTTNHTNTFIILSPPSGNQPPERIKQITDFIFSNQDRNHILTITANKDPLTRAIEGLAEDTGHPTDHWNLPKGKTATIFIQPQFQPAKNKIG